MNDTLAHNTETSPSGIHPSLVDGDLVERIVARVASRLGAPQSHAERVAERRAAQATQRSAVERLEDELDPMQMPEERSLPALLAMVFGADTNGGLAQGIVQEVRSILDLLAQSDDDPASSTAYLCVRKLDAALELMRRTARPRETSEEEHAEQACAAAAEE